MGAEYVREFYDVPPSAKRGARVRVDGRPGVIVTFPQQYLGVRFAGQKRVSRCHPTWRVEYLCPLCDGAITRDQTTERWQCAPCVVAERAKGAPNLRATLNIGTVGVNGGE